MTVKLSKNLNQTITTERYKDWKYRNIHRDREKTDRQNCVQRKKRRYRIEKQTAIMCECRDWELNKVMQEMQERYDTKRDSEQQ